MTVAHVVRPRCHHIFKYFLEIIRKHSLNFEDFKKTIIPVAAQINNKVTRRQMIGLHVQLATNDNAFSLCLVCLEYCILYLSRLEK